MHFVSFHMSIQSRYVSACFHGGKSTDLNPCYFFWVGGGAMRKSIVYKSPLLQDLYELTDCFIATIKTTEEKNAEKSLNRIESWSRIIKNILIENLSVSLSDISLTT